MAPEPPVVHACPKWQHWALSNVYKQTFWQEQRRQNCLDRLWRGGLISNFKGSVMEYGVRGDWQAWPLWPHDAQEGTVGPQPRETRSQSYQTFIFPVFRFSLLSLKVCCIWKNVCAVQRPSLVAKNEKILCLRRKRVWSPNYLYIAEVSRLNK